MQNDLSKNGQPVSVGSTCGSAAATVANKLAANHLITWQDAAGLLHEHQVAMDTLKAIVERDWMVCCDYGDHEEWDRVMDAGRALLKPNTQDVARPQAEPK